MKKIVHNVSTLLTGIIGFIGGLIWGINSNWDYEPLILMSVSAFEIIAYLVIPKVEIKQGESIQKTKQVVDQKVDQNVHVTINNPNSNSKTEIETKSTNPNGTPIVDHNAIIESKKDKIGILFIDDDKNFNVVKILKDSNWKRTKSVTDIKSLDVNQVRESEIIFVDINGVGQILNLKYEGLDLALMLKQKYPEKKIVIYSANKTSYSFHEAWDLIDGRLEKNALPYQFQNMVENFSLEYYN